MKYKIFAILMILTAAFSAQLFAGESTLTLPEYIQLVLENSTALEAAEVNAEDAVEAQDEAGINQVSLFDLELLRVNAEYLQQNIFAVQNAEILTAVQHYYTYLGVQTSLGFAGMNEEIASAEYQRNQERFESDLISVQAIEQAEFAYITSSQSLNSAENNLHGQKKQIFRPLLTEWEETGFTDYIIVEHIPQIPKIGDLIAANPLVQKLEAEIAVKDEKLIQLKKSTFAVPSELEQLADVLESLRTTLQNQVWDIEDSLHDFITEMAASSLAMQAAELQINLAYRQLEIVKLQMQQGEIYPSDVTAAEIPYLQAINSREGVAQDRFLQILELQALVNESLLLLFE
jgi:hypothetical protein